MTRITRLSALFAAALALARAGGQPEAALERIPEQRDPGAAGIGRTIANLGFTPLDGTPVTLEKLVEDRKCLVIAMTSAECPIARKYAPRVAALETEFETRAAFVFVNVVEGESAETMRAAVRSLNLRGPYATDASGAIRRELRPITTTEVFVLDAARRLVYRGAVDDQFRVGGAAEEVTRRLLREAIEATLAGKSPPIAATRAPGCLVDMPRERAAAAAPYYPRIAEIIASNCVECHRLGGNAPFSLESPGAVEGRSAMIAAVVREGIMPPTHGLRAGADLVRDRAMSDEDRDALIAWLKSSRELGAAPAPATARDVSNVWTIGSPDLILTTPGPALPIDGPLRCGRYLVPLNLDGDRWVESIECRPVMRDSVEQSLIWLVRPGGAVPAPGATPPAPELLATYSRSDPLVRFGPGAGVLLPAGALLIVDSYSRPMGKVTVSQLRIAMKFAGARPQREASSMIVSAGPFTIDAGDADKRVEASATLDAPLRVTSLQPCMGPRGREATIEATLPGEKPRTLIELSRYDWRWQMRYTLLEPLDLPAGTRLTIRARFDNSSANLANPDPSRAVTMGIGADHEMLLLSVGYEKRAQ